MASVATREPAAPDRRGRRRRPLAVLVLGAVAVAGGWLAAPAAAALDDYPPALSAAPLDSAVDQWGFFNRECTSFVAWRMAQAGVSRAEVGFADSWGPAPGGLDHWGDATGWDAYAAALGYRVDATAAVGAIAQWHGGERGGGLVASAEGHVAYVAGVAPDGSAT